MTAQSINTKHDAIEQIAMELLIEKRRTRRWRIFFRIFWLVIILFILFRGYAYHSHFALNKTNHFTAIIDLSETIDSDHDSANKLITELEAAYQHPNTKGIIIRANSPGGTPVQAGIAFDEIRRLKRQHPNIPIYTVVEDICASGCYYIACATDKIYVDKASIIGSIGVRSDGFGFVGSMKKMGIERRLYTAGNNKAIGDPFSPNNPTHQIILQSLINRIHKQFIQAVKIGRGNRLKNHSGLFAGQIYLGEEGYQLGLADGLSNVRIVAENIIKAKTLENFTIEEPFVDQLKKHLGVSTERLLFQSILSSMPIQLR